LLITLMLMISFVCWRSYRYRSGAYGVWFSTKLAWPGKTLAWVLGQRDHSRSLASTWRTVRGGASNIKQSWVSYKDQSVGLAVLEISSISLAKIPAYPTISLLLGHVFKLHGLNSHIGARNLSYSL